MTDLEDRIHKVTVVLEEERARKAEVREERENGYPAHTHSQHIVPAFVKLGSD